MKPHLDKAIMDVIFPYIRQYQALASTHGIDDIFQDNGGKLLQLLMVTGLTILPGREGADAQDEEGNEYELKTLNVLKTTSFSTNHHLNPKLISHYRKVYWLFAVYRDIELQEIYRLEPANLEPFFEKWEKEWYKRGEKDLNNPKIPLQFVHNNGELVYRLEEMRPSSWNEQLQKLRDYNRKLIEEQG